MRINCIAIVLLAMSPFVLAVDPPPIPAPKIPEGVFKITDYGAVGDGKTSSTAAFAKTMEACEKAGGGTVVVPAGTYFTGPIRLVSNLNFHLDEGAVLLFSNNQDDYPMGG